uniref:MICOS complex subunit n=1 Tax=Amphiprion percula TaxID=161767 RepID=A0A3P8TV47_AMPPE
LSKFGGIIYVTGSAMLGALRFLPVVVFADADEAEKETPAPASLNRDDLSLYATPPQTSRYAEPEAGQLEESVATIRKLVEPYAAWCQDTYGRIKPTVQRVVRFGSDTYAYLKDPPKDFYPRAGVIGFTGVLGLLLARGSRVKRLVYPAGLMTVSASLYYPEKAANVAKSTGDSVYDWAVQSYAAVEKMLNPSNKKPNSSKTADGQKAE